MLQSLGNLVTESGFAYIFTAGDGWKNLVMVAIACVLLYLGIKKQYEPLLMVGIAMGCLLKTVLKKRRLNRPKILLQNVVLVISVKCAGPML